MCEAQVVLYHSQGLLRHRHRGMAYLRPITHDAQSSAPNHPTRGTAKREYLEAKEDSKPDQGDGSPQWIVNMWAMMWGSKRPTPCALYGGM